MKGQTVFEDFAPYPPLKNAPAAFVASPVHNHVGGIDGVAFLRPDCAISRGVGRGLCANITEGD